MSSENAIHECRIFKPNKAGVLNLKKTLSIKYLTQRFWELRKQDTRSYQKVSEDWRNKQGHQTHRKRIHFGDYSDGDYTDESY
ncbi:hypothetical protein KAR91_26375 [Candidatus Pacearchaeota archaeon]|nr:hypothetical protein [Candidatus Pacearchaeota archaeon]